MIAYDIVWTAVVGGLVLGFLASLAVSAWRQIRAVDQSDEIEQLRTRISALESDLHLTADARDSAIRNARIAGEVNEELRRRVAGIEELLDAVATRAESLHAYHGEAVAEIRGVVDRAMPGNAGQSAGNPRAIAGQSGWISVADELPGDHDEEVVAMSGGFPVLAYYGREIGWVNHAGSALGGVRCWARLPGREGSGSAARSLGGGGGGDSGLDDIDVDPERLGQLDDHLSVRGVRPGGPALERDAGEPVRSGEGGDRAGLADEQITEGGRSGAH